MTATAINKFAVPAEARAAFLAEFQAHRAFLAAQPGFREGRLYEQTGGPGRFNLVNLAVWADAPALAAARRAMAAHYQALGRDPGAVYRALGVESDIATYTEIETY